MFKNYLEEKKEIIEKNLKKSLSKYKYPERLSEGMEYAVMNGGKRIRPVIMYIICDLFEKEYKYIEDIALALEFIHCYSLVHDDLPALDDDMYRRGKLTTHIKYDEATAILVGDALLTEAFNIISDSKNIKDKNKVQIIRKLSEYAGFYGMIGGQYLDIESENKEVSIETLEYIHTHKTGKLLTASVELPLIALDIEDEKIEKLIEYSKLIGIVFQIKDDILDIEGTFEETGKESTDIKNDKKTYPSLFGMEKSKEMLNDYINRAKNIIIENCDENKLFIELVDFFGNRGV